MKHSLHSSYSRRAVRLLLFCGTERIGTAIQLPLPQLCTHPLRFLLLLLKNRFSSTMYSVCSVPFRKIPEAGQF